jgi:type IV secretion system protein VirD4
MVSEDRARSALEQRMRELDRDALQRKWDFDRQRRQANQDLDRRKRDVQREMEREASKRRTGAMAGTGGMGQDLGGVEDMVLTAAVVIAAVVGVAAGLALVTGHLSALAYDGGWPSYQMSDVPGVLGRLVRNPGDPAAAWKPVNNGAEVPGAFGFWSIYVLLLGLAGAVGFLVYAWRSTQPRAQTPRAYWADRTEVARLRVTDTDVPRLVVGTSGRAKLALAPMQSLLVLGPAHAGKTTGLAIPALLEWPGPAVVASTKSHLMDDTIGWRSHRGDVHVYDPAAVTRYHRSGWSLLFDCGTWQGAIRMSQHLTAAAQATLGGRFDGDDGNEADKGPLWTGAMAMALAPFLYAAAADGRSVMEAAEWVEREERDAVTKVLRPIDPGAAHAHETTFYRDDPSRSHYFHVMYQVLSVYGDPSVAATAAKHEIVTSELLDGGEHTVYLTAPDHDQVRFQPLFATIVRQVLTAATDRFAAEGTPLDPPLLLLLDEAVGVTSVEDLAAIAATGAPKGVQVVSIFQDLGKWEGLQRDASGLLAKDHRAVLVLPGDRSFGASGSPTDDMLADVSAQLGPGEGALLLGTSRPVRLKARPWYQDGELRRRAQVHQDVIAPSERRLPVARRPPTAGPDYALVDQTRVWLRRRELGPFDDTLTGDNTAEMFEPASDDESAPGNVTPLRDPRSGSRRDR